MSPSLGVAPVYRDDDRLAGLIGPGGPFEVADAEVGGILIRSFVRAPESIVDIFAMARAQADRVHVVLDAERVTFGEVRGQALSLAREMKRTFGVLPGDRVAIAMRNLPEFVVTFWAAVVAGAVVVPLNAWWTGPELEYAIGDAGASVVVADEERLQRLRGARPGGPLRPGAAAGGAGEADLVAVRTDHADPYGAVPFDALAAGPPLPDAEWAQPGPDDPVTLLYTSGTTGRPKGALGSHRAAIANLMNMAFASAREAALSGRPPRPLAQPASLAAAPLFHVGGIASIIGGPMSGSKLVLMHKWDVETGLALARAEGVTSLGGVPAIARQVLYHPEVANLGLDVRTIPLGGAAVPPDLPKRARQVFGDTVQIFNGYGSTETTSAVVINIGAEYAARPDSVGRPNLTADLRVAGPDGQEVPVGQVGELCFRSPQVVNGYWNRPADTAAAFAGGWFHTGDLGYVDAEGFVYVVDRLKDMVIRGGENVYSAEVEAVLFECPGVADVAIIGLPDEAMGERVCAVLVTEGSGRPDLRTLRAFASERLAGFKCPEALFVTDELPKTATGKVAKAELRAKVAASGAALERAF